MYIEVTLTNGKRALINIPMITVVVETEHGAAIGLTDEEDVIPVMESYDEVLNRLRQSSVVSSMVSE